MAIDTRMYSAQSDRNRRRILPGLPTAIAAAPAVDDEPRPLAPLPEGGNVTPAGQFAIAPVAPAVGVPPLSVQPSQGPGLPTAIGPVPLNPSPVASGFAVQDQQPTQATQVAAAPSIVPTATTTTTPSVAAQPGVDFDQPLGPQLTVIRDQRIQSELGQDPAEIRRANDRRRREYRTAKVQIDQQIRDLNRRAQQLAEFGDTAGAQELRSEIVRLRSGLNQEAREIGLTAQSLRGSLSDLSPEDQATARERSRAQLNAQLPAVAEAAGRNAQQASDSFTSRLAQVGAEALRLETGIDPSGYDPQVLAQYASEQASPEAIQQVTRGVGLPTNPAPGAADFSSRVDSLIQSGGIQFPQFNPQAPNDLDAQAINSTVEFQSDLESEASAERAIESASRRAQVASAEAGAAQAEEAARFLGADIPSPSQASESTEGGSDRFAFGEAARREITGEEGQTANDVILGVSSGSLASGIRDAIQNNNTALLESYMAQLQAALQTDAGVSDRLRRETAAELRNQLADLEVESDATATTSDTSLFTNDLGAIAEAAALGINSVPGLRQGLGFLTGIYGGGVPRTGDSAANLVSRLAKTEKELTKDSNKAIRDMMRLLDQLGT